MSSAAMEGSGAAVVPPVEVEETVNVVAAEVKDGDVSKEAAPAKEKKLGEAAVDAGATKGSEEEEKKLGKKAMGAEESQQRESPAAPAVSGIRKRKQDGSAAASSSTQPAAGQVSAVTVQQPAVAAAPAPPAVSSGIRKRKRDGSAASSSSTEPAARQVSAVTVQVSTVTVQVSAVTVQQPSVAAAPAPAPLRRLLEACQAMLGASNAPPMASVVPIISGIMNTIGPDDVGLRDEMRYFNRMNVLGLQNPPIITCKTIHECSSFTVAVFFLPLRSVMPLHDHPGMTVFSKMLIGSARLEAYDWVRPRVMGTLGPRMLAEKARDHDVTAAASGTWVLFPDAGGNMHRFVVPEDGHCAFLDVLTPPYAAAEQRGCTYYHDTPYYGPTVGGGSGGRHPLSWLEEIPMPRSVRIVNLPFRGPRII